MALTWTFSDGTSVELGGKIVGRSAFAATLRGDTMGPRPVQLLVHAPPCPRVSLDLDNPALVDVWLRNEARIAGVTLESGPSRDDLPKLPAPRSPRDLPAGTVY